MTQIHLTVEIAVHEIALHRANYTISPRRTGLRSPVQSGLMCLPQRPQGLADAAASGGIADRGSQEVDARAPIDERDCSVHGCEANRLCPDDFGSSGRVGCVDSA